MNDRLLIPAKEFARLIGQTYETVEGWFADDDQRQRLEARRARDGRSWLIPRSKLGEYEPKFRVASELAEVLSWVRARRVAREYLARQRAEARAAVVTSCRGVCETDGSDEAIEELRKAILRYARATSLEPIVREVEAEASKAIAAADCLYEPEDGPQD